MGLISNIANIWLSSWKSVPVDLGGATQVVTQSGGAGSRMFSLINSAVSSGSTGAVMLTMTVTTLLSSATLAYDIVVDNDSPLQVQETVFDSGVITDEEGNYLPEVFIDENGNIILADASASEAFSMMDLSRAVNDPDFDFSYFADRFDITSGLLADSDDLIDDTELSEDELLLLFNEEDEEDEGEEILLLDEEAETAEEEVALADNLVAANNVADDTANVELPVPAVIPSPEPVAEPVYIPAPAPAPTPAPTPAPIVKSNQQGFAIANPGTLTYGDANLQLLTTGGNGNGAVTFERISGTSLNVTQSGLISIESFGDTVIKTTKAGDSNYNAASASLTISVNKRNVTITPDSGQGKVRHEIEPPLTFTANPALVGNDTFQGALNRASGETVGNYGITLGSLDAGNNYNLTLGSNVNFTITLATPNYTLPTDLTATYGESLSDITLPLGWAWNAPGDLVGNAGERAHKAAFTPVDTDNYSIITVDLTVTVAKANQASISIDNPASLTYGDADVQLTTTGGSGTGAVSFERVSGTSLNVSSSGILTVQSAGDTVIEVTKAGDNNYNIASNILTISVNKLAVAITPDSGQAKVRHEADPPLTFTANPALIGSDAFQGALSRTLGETVGAYDITLGNLSAGNNYNLTLTGNTQFTITSAIPNYTLPTGLEAAYGALLSGITLPSGWTWNKPSDLVGNLGEQIHEATFTPTDTVNYTTVTLDLDVTVTKAVPTVANIPTASQMNTGNMLSSSTLSGGTVNGITGENNLSGTWAWENPTAIVNASGSFTAIFTPTNVNYESASANVNVTAIELSPITVATGGTSTDYPNLTDALTAIRTTPGNHIVTVRNDQAIATQGISTAGVIITLIGEGGERKINLSSNGSIFSLSNGSELILGQNITLVGRSLGGNGNANNNNVLISVGSGSKLTMHEGAKITDNASTATAEASANGAVQVAANGAFHMLGGEISGNSRTAATTNALGAGGLYAAANSTVILEGGSIHGNSGGGGDIYFAGSGTYTLAGDFSAETVTLNATAASARAMLIVSSGWSGEIEALDLRANNTNHTTAQTWWINQTVLQPAAGYTLTASDIARINLGTFYSTATGNNTLILSPLYEIYTNGALGISISNAPVAIKNNVTEQVTGYTDLTAARAAIVANGDYTVTIRAEQNLAIWTLPTGAKVTFIGEGGEQKINLSGNGAMFTLNNANTELTLGENITLVGRSASGNGNANNNNPVVSVQSGALLTMLNGSKITGNASSPQTSTNVNLSAAVHITGTGSRFNMLGGAITENKRVNDNAPTAYGAGGLFAEANTIINLSGGSISGNKVGTNDENGDIYFAGSGTFNISGDFNAGTVTLNATSATARALLTIPSGFSGSINALNLRGANTNLSTALSWWFYMPVLQTSGGYTLTANDIAGINLNTLYTTLTTAGNTLALEPRYTISATGSLTRSVLAVEPGTIVIDMFHSASTGWSGNAALQVFINGNLTHDNVKVQTVAANNNPAGQRSTNTFSFAVSGGDVVEIKYVAGASNQIQNGFIIYHEDNVPDPAFAANNYGTWNGNNDLLVGYMGEPMNSGSGMANYTTGMSLGSFTVNDTDNARPPRITSEPVSNFYVVDDTAELLSLTAVSPDSGTLSYQWYRNSTNSNVGGTLISGATFNDYTPDTSQTGTAYYYCVVTNTDTARTGNQTATRTSKIAEIKVVTAAPVYHIIAPGIEKPYESLTHALNTITAAGSYTFKLTADQELSDRTLNTANVHITLIGEGAERKITHNGTAAQHMFNINNANTSLTLSENITLVGRIAAGAGSVVNVTSGIFNMESGSKVTGHNVSSFTSAAVLIGTGGTFNINGGIVTNNTRSSSNAWDIYFDGITNAAGMTITGNSEIGTLVLTAINTTQFSKVNVTGFIGNAVTFHLRGNNGTMATVISYWEGRRVLQGSATEIAKFEPGSFINSGNTLTPITDTHLINDNGFVVAKSISALGAPVVVTKSGSSDESGYDNLMSAIAFANASGAGDYTITIKENQTINTQQLINNPGVKITLIGDGSEKIITHDATSTIFVISDNDACLTLGNNITIHGRAVANSSNVISVSSGMLIMENGAKITGHNTTSIYGAVHITGENSVFIMNGGEISGNNTSGNYSVVNAPNGGVSIGTSGFAADNATFIMNGGTVTGNTHQDFAADVFTSNCRTTFILSGNANIGSLRLLVTTTSSATARVNIKDSFTGNITSLHLRSSANNGTMTSNMQTTVSEWTNRVVVAGIDGYTPTANDITNINLGEFMASANSSGTSVGATQTITNTHVISTYDYNYGHLMEIPTVLVSKDGGSDIGYANLTAALNAISTTAGDYEVKISANQTITNQTINTSNVKITLIGDGNVRQITSSANGAMFTVGASGQSGIEFTLGNNITLTGRSANNNSVVRVNNGASFTMLSGSKITGNTSSGSSDANGRGAAVHVNGSSSVFTMKGGEITGNSSNAWQATPNNYFAGGLFIAADSIVNLEGGKISDNSAPHGDVMTLESVTISNDFECDSFTSIITTSSKTLAINIDDSFSGTINALNLTRTTTNNGMSSIKSDWLGKTVLSFTPPSNGEDITQGGIITLGAGVITLGEFISTTDPREKETIHPAYRVDNDGKLVLNPGGMMGAMLLLDFDLLCICQCGDDCEPDCIHTDECLCDDVMCLCLCTCDDLICSCMCDDLLCLCLCDDNCGHGNNGGFELDGSDGLDGIGNDANDGSNDIDASGNSDDDVNGQDDNGDNYGLNSYNDSGDFFGVMTNGISKIEPMVHQNKKLVNPTTQSQTAKTAPEHKSKFLSNLRMIAILVADFLTKQSIR